MMATGNYGQLSLDDLVVTARSHAAPSEAQELRAELDRRNIIEAIKASKAQVGGAWCQVATAVAMCLTLLATVAAPWVKP